MKSFAELSADAKRIEVTFKYSPEAVDAINNVSGARWNPKSRFWTVPADLMSARRLREEFGAGLELGQAVRVWGRLEKRRQRELASLTTANDAELMNVSAESAAWLRPYQRADVKMMATTNVLNANQPGVGKTVEAIYSVIERADPGLHVVVAPTTLFQDPWADELGKHFPEARVFWSNAGPAPRRKAAQDAVEFAKANPAAHTWLLINPDLIRCDKVGDEPDERPVLSRDHKGNAYVAKAEVAFLFRAPITTLIADEFHKFGLGKDRNTLFARALYALGKNSATRHALSGTPTGGVAVRLWGVLNFIEPETYSSKWRWAENWLDISEEGMGKKIGDIVKGREQEFENAHAKHLVRRLRSDALPGLPDKVIIEEEVLMTRSQAKQYKEFVANAEVAATGGRISAEGTLAEFARLKQIANARCEVVDGEVFPTTDSGKLPLLLDRLDTHGVRASNPEPGARAIVASESKRMANVAASYLLDHGLDVRTLDGSVTGAKRDEVIAWYKAESPQARVLAMTTQTGGVGLNLGMTGSIHILDETWNPDDQEQLEDRGMRNRTTPLVVRYYRTKGTIQEYIAEVGYGKKEVNKNLLDIWRALRTQAGVA